MKQLFLCISIATVSLGLSSCSLEKRVGNYNARYLKKAPFDAVIIPGYPYRAETNQILFNVRLAFARDLYNKGITKHIIFSGAATHTPFEEGPLMKAMADSAGLPVNVTFSENRALHSNQNIVYGKKLAKELGFKNVVVATDPYQFAYMTVLMKLYAPGMGIISFPPAQMPVYDQEPPVFDSTAFLVKNFVPLKSR